jgi:hypothetical protein
MLNRTNYVLASIANEMIAKESTNILDTQNKTINTQYDHKSLLLVFHLQKEVQVKVPQPSILSFNFIKICKQNFEIFQPPTNK